jgi:hypothetical protein
LNLARNKSLQESIKESVISKLDDITVGSDSAEDVAQRIASAETLDDAARIARSEHPLAAEAVEEVVSVIKASADDQIERVFTDPALAKSMASSTLQRAGQTMSRVVPSAAARQAASAGAGKFFWTGEYSFGALFRRWRDGGAGRIAVDSVYGLGLTALAACMGLVTIMVDDPEIKTSLFEDPELSKALNHLNINSKYCFGNATGKRNLVMGCKVISYTLRKCIQESEKLERDDDQKQAIATDIASAQKIITFFDKLRTGVETNQSINYSDISGG